jgi:nitrate/nitrite transport system permease protein
MIENIKVRGAIISVAIFIVFLFMWEMLTQQPAFNATGLTQDELLTKEFNGDIVRDENDRYIYNPDKPRGIPGPAAVLDKCIEELSGAFEIRGTNDHGIAYLIWYTVKRFAVGFLSASVIAVLLGLLIGSSKVIFMALNPFIQVLKPISPLAWMPLLLYSVKDPFYTAILVVFMASLWPTVANTAFGVNAIKTDYLRVASLLEMNRFTKIVKVILPAAAPAIIAGLRISFGSALVAVVPAEMLLGELGIGYLSWIEWNNLDISGVLFAIIVVGVVGVILDSLFNVLAKLVSYPDL